MNGAGADARRPTALAALVRAQPATLTGAQPPRSLAAAVARLLRALRRSGNTRATQALELVSSRPGITIPEIAQAMKIQPNYLYRVLPRLASEGQIKRDGQGWHPGSGSTSNPSPAKSPRRARATKSQPTSSAATAKGRSSARTKAATNGRTGRGATTASVLAALAGGEAMTASQVAESTGLGRASVSTTLSKLARAGDVKKANRGYQLADGAASGDSTQSEPAAAAGGTHVE